MPEATVAGIVTSYIAGKLHILLTRRAFGVYQDTWCLPGGHIDSYEKALDAVIREVKEETGLDFAARFYAIFDEIIPEKSIHAVVLTFTGEGTGTPAGQPGEVSEMGWFTPDEAQTLPLAFDHLSIIRAFAAGLPKEGAG